MTVAVDVRCAADTAVVVCRRSAALRQNYAASFAASGDLRYIGGVVGGEIVCGHSVGGNRHIELGTRDIHRGRHADARACGQAACGHGSFFEEIEVATCIPRMVVRDPRFAGEGHIAGFRVASVTIHTAAGRGSVVRNATVGQAEGVTVVVHTAALLRRRIVRHLGRTGHGKRTAGINAAAEVSRSVLSRLAAADLAAAHGKRCIIKHAAASTDVGGRYLVPCDQAAGHGKGAITLIAHAAAVVFSSVDAVFLCAADDAAGHGKGRTTSPAVHTAALSSAVAGDRAAGEFKCTLVVHTAAVARRVVGDRAAGHGKGSSRIPR